MEKETMGMISNVAGPIMGLALQGVNDKRQIRQQERLNAQQMKYDKQMAVFNQGMAMDMWNKTNYSAQMQQLRKAGLNPGLIYGQGGGGGATTNTPTGNVKSPTAPGGGGEVGMGLQMGLQVQMTKAQIDLIEAQKRNVDADTEQKGVNTGIGQINREVLQRSKENMILKIKAEKEGAQAEAATKIMSAAVDYYATGGKGFFNVEKWNIDNSILESPALKATLAAYSEAVKNNDIKAIELHFAEIAKELGLAGLVLNAATGVIGTAAKFIKR